MSVKPSLKPQILPFLTVIPHRSPVQKMHTSLGHAKNALTYDKSRSGELWEWNTETNEWDLLYTVTSKVVDDNDWYRRYVQDVPWR